MFLMLSSIVELSPSSSNSTKRNLTFPYSVLRVDYWRVVTSMETLRKCNEISMLEVKL